jgi:hypothetical protein
MDLRIVNFLRSPVPSSSSAIHCDDHLNYSTIYERIKELFVEYVNQRWNTKNHVRFKYHIRLRKSCT